MRQLVRNLIDERCAGKAIPVAVQEFLLNQWQNVLFLLYIKEGERSASWLDGCQIIDDLVWSTTPHNDEKSRQRLEQMVEPLYARIVQKLQLTALSTSAIDESMASLKSIHASIRNDNGASLQYTTIETAASPSTAVSESAPQQAEEKSWESMTAIERQQVQTQRLQYEFIQKAERLPIGTWIEFTSLNGEPGPLRFKLTAKVDLTDSFVFVNRFGTKVVEKSRKSFATDLQNSVARVLERGSAFDRAITRIANNLREMKAA